MSNPLVSVIIPHWNGTEVLSECLESLVQTAYPNYEIIVVDNASTDGSPDWVSLNFPQVKLVKNDQNYGYAGGCNRGAGAADGEFVVFLNNDTVQDHHWLDGLVDFMNLNPNVAAVQPKILNFFEREKFDYAGGAGGWLDVLGFPFVRGRVFLEREADEGQYDKMRPIFWASGTAIMVRKYDFETAGGFDETFFAHQEEIDLCWRFHLMGREVWSSPGSVVFHKNAVTLPMFSRQKQYLNHRNSLLMVFVQLQPAPHIIPNTHPLGIGVCSISLFAGSFRYEPLFRHHSIIAMDNHSPSCCLETAAKGKAGPPGEG